MLDVCTYVCCMIVCMADTDTDGNSYWGCGDCPFERDVNGQRHAAVAQFEVRAAAAVPVVVDVGADWWWW